MGWGKSVNWSIMRSLKLDFTYFNSTDWTNWPGYTAIIPRDFDQHDKDPDALDNPSAWEPTTATVPPFFYYNREQVSPRQAQEMKNFRISADLRMKTNQSSNLHLGDPAIPWRYVVLIIWYPLWAINIARAQRNMPEGAIIIGEKELTIQSNVWHTVGMEFIDGEAIFYASQVPGRQKFDADFVEFAREQVPGAVKNSSNIYAAFSFSGTAESNSNFTGGDNIWLEEGALPPQPPPLGPYYEENLKIPEFPILFLPEIDERGLDKANLTLRQIWENLNAIEGIQGNFYQGRSSLGPTHWRYVDDNGEQIHGIGEV